MEKGTLTLKMALKMAAMANEELMRPLRKLEYENAQLRMQCEITELEQELCNYRIRVKFRDYTLYQTIAVICLRVACPVLKQ